MTGSAAPVPSVKSIIKDATICQASPIHQHVADHLQFSRINNAEVMPGVTPAASWTFWDAPIDRAFRGAMYALGTANHAMRAVPDDRSQRLRAMFYGRIATNITFHRAIARHMPPVLESALVEHLFADETEREIPVDKRVKAYRWKIPLLIWRLPTLLRQHHTQAKIWWRQATDPARRPMDMRSALASLRESGERFEHAMTLNIVATLLSAIPIQRIMAAAKAADLGELIPAVISGYGTEEAVMAARFAAIARGEDTVAAFLTDFGFHGQAEGQLHRRSWRESPEVVASRIEQFRAGNSHHRSSEGVQAAKRAAEDKLKDGSFGKARLRLYLGLAHRLMPQREITKAWYLMTIDAARAALRRIGELGVESGVLEQAEDASHLTMEELLSGPSPAWRAIALERRKEWQDYHALDIPERFTGMPTPIVLSEASSESALTHLTGLGVSAGVAEGPARVVQESDGVDDLLDGEILVCRSTDPSWAPAFMIASGVVIDIGSMLSHGAIVARELGLPCVINIGNATSAIRTGDVVRIDGSTGTVDILERAAA